MEKKSTIKTTEVGGFNLATLTFAQLKSLVGTTEDLSIMPTTRQLIVREEELLFSAEESGALITVFKAGFFIYHSENGSTVFAVDRCRSIRYQGTSTATKVVSEEEYNDAHWSIPLIANAENRIEHNGDRKSESHCAFSITGIEDDWNYHLMVENFEDALLESMVLASRKERLENALLTLPEYQFKVITMRYWQGLNDVEIAKELKISQPAVWKARNKAIENLKRNF